MGLDITHYKSTLKRPEQLNPFNRNYKIENEFEGFKVDFNYFHNCIQVIDTPKTIETIIFPKKENEIDEVQEFLKNVNYHFLFERDRQNIEKSVQIFLSKNHLTENLLHSWETEKWIGFHVFKMEKQTGFYFEEIGEQRKGINKHFWSRFASDEIYNFTQKEDFEYALKCVDFYWDSDTEEEVELRKKIFKKDFVDQYELNKSWLNLSY